MRRRDEKADSSNIDAFLLRKKGTDFDAAAIAELEEGEEVLESGTASATGSDESESDSDSESDSEG